MSTEGQATVAEQEYLETIFWLYEAGLPMTGANIARAMQLSAPTVHEMIGRLERDGYVTRGTDRSLSFTESGREHAEHIVSRHRMIERFLTDVLGIPWDEVHEEAERIEHAMSPVLEERMFAAIGDAKTCPHGHPINTGSRIDGVPLADCEPGASIRILRFENEAEELLHYLHDRGVEPELEGTFVAPGDEEITIELDGKEIALTTSVAETVSVVADPSPPPRVALPEQLVISKDRYGAGLLEREADADLGPAAAGARDLELVGQAGDEAETEAQSGAVGTGEHPAPSSVTVTRRLPLDTRGDERHRPERHPDVRVHGRVGERLADHEHDVGGPLGADVQRLERAAQPAPERPDVPRLGRERARVDLAVVYAVHGGGARSSGSSTSTSISSTPVSERSLLDRGSAAHHREVVPVAAGVLVLPDQLAQRGHVHEGQAAQVQHDVAHAGGLRLELVDHLGDLRDGDEVELAPEGDERGPAVGVRFDLEVIGAGGVRFGHGTHFLASLNDCANEGGEAENPKTQPQSRRRSQLSSTKSSSSRSGPTWVVEMKRATLRLVIRSTAEMNRCSIACWNALRVSATIAWRCSSIIVFSTSV